MSENTSSQAHTSYSLLDNKDAAVKWVEGNLSAKQGIPSIMSTVRNALRGIVQTTYNVATLPLQIPHAMNTVVSGTFGFASRMALVVSDVWRQAGHYLLGKPVSVLQNSFHSMSEAIFGKVK